MPIRARYAHTNIIAKNWRALARFYEQVFGCIPIPPERSISEEWLERGTGVPDAQLEGIHLRLPGYGESGPTLEIYQYRHSKERPSPAANRLGFAHIAFAVDDLEEARREVIDAGGQGLGRVVNAVIPSVGNLTFVYATDPEGNVLELQSWS